MRNGGIILVTGAGGQLGTELRHLTKRRKGFLFTDAVPVEGAEVLDICDPAAVDRFFAAHSVSAVINCAAYTNVDGAESDVERCRAVNVGGVRNLASAAKHSNAVLIHISTDYVFDGKRRRGAYREDSPCHPESVYGRTKREAELLIRRSKVRGIIIRTAWLYSPFGKNFVKTMLRLGAERPEVRVVADQIGTPTYAKDLAKAILKALPKAGGFKGELFHYTDEGACSWFDFAAATMVFAGLGCKVKPVSTSEYPTPAKRPAYSLLDKSKIRDTFGVDTPWWSVSLQDCLRRL
ncbi:MAG: dTDP-4-dehydrorhamnose reductase [Bacteroidales bacterium]|nr:dTDP-4-dehydrorhamnose reductase [Bacteroidales bacterium]